jgi:hypothetical protein
MKRPGSADPVLPTITEDLPLATFVPLYIRHQGRASPERLVLRDRPSTARMPPNDSAGQGAKVHRGEAGIVDEAGTVRFAPSSSAQRFLATSASIVRHTGPMALCIQSDEFLGVVSGPVGARGLERLLA